MDYSLRNKNLRIDKSMSLRRFVARIVAVGALAICSSCGSSSAEVPASQTTNSPTAVTAPAPAPDLPTSSSTGLTVSAKTLAGADPIDDNFDYGAAFEPTTYGANGTVGIPGFGRLDDLGAFRFFCRAAADQLLKDDPIVYPGQPGKSHLHMFIGNDRANASSTYESLRTTGGSTCDNPGQPWAINRSSYWTPAMMDGAGHAVLPDNVLVYYKRFPIQGPGCVGPMAVGICTDLPNGLRFIFGYDMKTKTGGPTGEGTRDYWSMSYACAQNDAGTANIPSSATARFHSIADVAQAGCPVGARLEVKLDAPECWDGRNLDTADHRSHVVYAPDGTDKGLGYVCPQTHPYVIPLISYFWMYTVDENFVAGKWHLSSDEMLTGFTAGANSQVKAGTSLHMDYFEAWSPKAKAAWQNNCINGPRSCSSGDMGDGTAIKGAGIPAEGWLNHRLVTATAM